MWLWEARAALTPFALIAVGHPEHKPEPKGPTRYDETRVHWI